MTMSDASVMCPCQSGRRFNQCCGRFLDGSKFAKTPVQLMRSRYSAFALGGYGDYLVKTWSPEGVAGMNAAELSMKSTHWVGLEIMGKSQRGEQGFVEFKAFFLDANGERCLHHEKSTFVRVNGRWLYEVGDVIIG